MADKNPPRATRPAAYGWFWDWFWDMNSVRRHTQSGPEPLSYGEIETWARVTGTFLSSKEVAIIRAMDTAFIREIGEEYRDQREREQSRQRAEGNR